MEKPMLLSELFENVYSQHAYFVRKFADLVEQLDLKQRAHWIKKYQIADSMFQQGDARKDKRQIAKALNMFEDLIAELMFAV